MEIHVVSAYIVTLRVAYSRLRVSVGVATEMPIGLDLLYRVS